MTLVQGEAGIGKSRLVAEWAGAARDGGALVAVGRWVEVARTALPLAPVAGVLRDLFRSRGPGSLCLPAGSGRRRVDADGAGDGHHRAASRAHLTGAGRAGPATGGTEQLGIGKRLFISPKTASVHVTHILAKLGATNRTQAAATAHRLGLDGAATSRAGPGSKR